MVNNHSKKIKKILNELNCLKDKRKYKRKYYKKILKSLIISNIKIANCTNSSKSNIKDEALLGFYLKLYLLILVNMIRIIITSLGLCKIAGNQTSSRPIHHINVFRPISLFNFKDII